MENGAIRHSQFSASADLPNYGLSYARLNGPRAWVAETMDRHQWFQVSFWKPVLITGVFMQGRQDANEWVTRYIVMTKMDLNITNWENVKDKAGNTEVLCSQKRYSNYCLHVLGNILTFLAFLIQM